MTAARTPGADACPATTDTASAERRADRRIAIAIWLLLGAIFGIFAGGHSYSSDEEGYFLQSRALLHGEFAIAPHDDAQLVTPVATGRDGHLIAQGGLGSPVAGLPALAVGTLAAAAVPDRWDDMVERLFTGFTNSLITAAIAALLFLCARRLGAARRLSTVLALAFGLGTMAWPHSKTLLFTEPLAALLVLASVYFAFRSAQEHSYRLAAAAGLFATLAGMARINTLMFALPIGVFVAVRAFSPEHNLRRASRATAAFSGGAAAGLFGMAVTNLWRAGSATALGYSNVPLDGNLWEGLSGLVLSPGKGIVIYAPIVIVAMAALPIAISRRRSEVTLLTAICTANLILFARFPSWHGDSAWGPRYLNITLPLMVLLVAPALSGRRWQQATLVTAVAGILINSLGAMVYFNQNFAQVQRELSTAGVTDPVYLDAIHFTVRRSPVVGHAGLLDDSVRGTSRDIRSGSASYPGTSQKRLYSYFRPQIDTWWYWIRTWQAPAWLLLFLPGLLAGGALGWRRVCTLLGNRPAPYVTALGAAAAGAGALSLIESPLTTAMVTLFVILAPLCLVAMVVTMSRTSPT
jgi:hypothetical protein